MIRNKGEYISFALPIGLEIQIAITCGDVMYVDEGCNGKLLSNLYVYLFISHISVLLEVDVNCET